MMTLNDDARKHLDNYLNQVRICLKGCSTVDADDVEQGIKEHIESELQDSSETISYDALDAVLKKLGSPQQWVPEEEIAWWRKFILRLRKGPEDWRLAYISFGLLVLGFLVGRSFFMTFIPASFIISRAVMSTVEDTNQLKGQKWLIYPSLFIIYVFLALGVLLWPVFPLAGIADWMEHLDIQRFPWVTHDSMNGLANYNPDTLVVAYWLIAFVLIAAATALWWVVLAIAHKKKPKILQAIFRPFADHIKPSHTNWFMGISFLLMMLCSVGGTLLIGSADWFLLRILEKILQ